MPDSFDAVVVGAGVLGAATAYELARSGRRTLAIDRLPAAGYGSTSSSSGVIRSFYSTVPSARLAWESYHAWLDWGGYVGDLDERGLARYRETGCLVVKTEDNDFMAPVCAVMADVGVPFEHWSAKDIAALYPGLDLRRYGPPKRPDDPSFGEAGPELIEGAVYFPNSGYVGDPQLAAHNLQIAAEAAGAQFRFNAEVTEINQAEGRVTGVSLKDGGEISSPVVVNIGGPHSNRLNDLAGVSGGMSLSTRALRKEVCYLPAPEGPEGRDLLIMDGDTGAYGRPETGGKIVAGSSEPACDELVWVDDPDADSLAFSEQWTVQAMRLGLRLPALGIPGQASGVVDFYDVSDDWTPIYDKSDLAGFYMACGTSGNQFKNAPMVGVVMAALIAACEEGHDHDAEALEIDLTRTGAKLNLGAFSRRRKIHGESSMSVLG